MTSKSLKYFLITTFLITLSGCGGGEGDKFISSEELNKMLVSGSESVETVNNKNRTDLTITGTNNTVNIETNLRNLDISGNNNLLNFSDNIAVGSCAVSGNDNSVVLSGSLTMTCTVTGAGNIGF